MEMITKNYVGIDYHSSKLQICVMTRDGRVLANRGCANDTSAAAKLIRSFGEVERVCAEACNGSVEFLEELSRATGWQKRLCHPGYVRRMRHNPDKSDKTDGELIAGLDRVDYLPQVWIAPLMLRDLRTLVRYRGQQLERRKRAKLRIRSILRQYRLRWESKSGLWTRAGLKWLESIEELPEMTLWVFRKHVLEFKASNTDLKEAERMLRKFAGQDACTQYLMSRRGIGFVVATAMRAGIGDFTRFRTGKELARFCGVSPCNASSGERQADAGLIHAGDPLLKTAVIEAAHSLIRNNPHWRKFAHTLYTRGKPYPVLVAAVANRWLRRLFWEVRNFQLQRATDLSCSSGSAELESLLG